ncbi:MAG: hypothetical protein DSY59_03530 [Persephonella sp.]|nr:MAG: hypothetical protein DSY59_03530 [Persephonella sp.]
MKELIESFKDKTVLMITHRLSLLNVVDRVIVMENGKIVEEGRVKELKLRNGLLNRFLQISKEIEN